MLSGLYWVSLVRTDSIVIGKKKSLHGLKGKRKETAFSINHCVISWRYNFFSLSPLSKGGW